MNNFKLKPIMGSFALLWGLTAPAEAGYFVQCPGDANSDAIVDGSCDPNDPGSTHLPPSTCGSYSFPSNTRCKHITAGDSYMKQADDRVMYFFSFHDITGQPEDQNMITEEGSLAHEAPAPTIVQDEGDDYYLTLSNVGMIQRPDLADPHTVHYHGFPNAGDVFDGVPEQSVSINEGASLTYFYRIVEPGTYFYHCHVEATEHMQMGMMGNLWVRPAQNRLPDGTDLNGHIHSNPDNPVGNTSRNQDDPLDGDKYVYNDGDGSTFYDVEYPLQINSWDGTFHDQSRDTQPLRFAEMNNDYGQINGRGYPDTTIGGAMMPPPAETDGFGSVTSNQPVSSKIVATEGQKILLRISNLNVIDLHTVRTLGLKMRIIGRGARILRGGGLVAGADLSHETTSVTLGGGEGRDVIIDTAGVMPGTYFLYTTNYNELSNGAQDYGGIMTEIEILPAV